jgi:hypothetical protein
MVDNPNSIKMEFDSIKMTSGYKCGKCCGMCCTTKYTFCSNTNQLRACTPYTSAEIGGTGFGSAGVAVGFGTACTAMCSLMCSTCCHNTRDQSCARCLTQPVCGPLTCVQTSGTITGGLLCIGLSFGIQMLAQCFFDKYCGRIAVSCGCPNFSRGFDERDD